MARATDRNAFKKEAERTFPHRVDIFVPGSGLGRRLTDMHAWCSANVAADEWAEHGHTERRKGFQPIEFARFYFMHEADAAAFRAQWVAD
jgi:hypothetical protein